MRKGLAALAIAGIAAAYACSDSTVAKKNVYMIGDSTMANNPLAKGHQERGRGQRMPT